MAPMSLLTYDEVRPWVKAIRENVAARKMPPWHATASAAPFMNDRSLSQAELDTLVAWIDQGAPRGNPADMPALPSFPEGEWKLGEPDFVITLPEEEIPAGDPNYEIRARYTFPQDAFIMGFAPHMHYRGKDFTYTAHYPDGRDELLLKVENYDFNWQTNYLLADKLPMPKGTTIECVAHFDNSADNPVNPDPTRNVTFGEETKDEMMIGFLDYVVADGVRPKTSAEIRLEFLAAWAEELPGDLYALRREKTQIVTPLYLPAQGEDRLLLRVNGQFKGFPVLEIVWTGDAFTARVATAQIGDIRIAGTRDAATGMLSVTLSNEQLGGDIHLEGGLHSEPKPAAD